MNKTDLAEKAQKAYGEVLKQIDAEYADDIERIISAYKELEGQANAERKQKRDTAYRKFMKEMESIKAVVDPPEPDRLIVTVSGVGKDKSELKIIGLDEGIEEIMKAFVLMMSERGYEVMSDLKSGFDY